MRLRAVLFHAVDGNIAHAGKHFYAVSGEAKDTHAEQEERDCSFCLEGWVFLGSIDHDGWPDRRPLSLTPTWGLLGRLQSTLWPSRLNFTGTVLPSFTLLKTPPMSISWTKPVNEEGLTTSVTCVLA